jgi:hypothetical protein
MSAHLKKSDPGFFRVISRDTHGTFFAAGHEYHAIYPLEMIEGAKRAEAAHEN